MKNRNTRVYVAGFDGKVQTNLQLEQKKENPWRSTQRGVEKKDDSVEMARLAMSLRNVLKRQALVRVNGSPKLC